MYIVTQQNGEEREAGGELWSWNSSESPKNHSFKGQGIG